MTKELIVSSSIHESSVALLEDDQLVEIYIARGAQHGLAGSIYKGRVTRVLPGMQSAFVNIGLDRDAFLYVSDFVGEMEDLDEPGSEPPAAILEIEKAAAKAAEVVGEPAETGERAEREERPERAERSERPERAERPDRGDRAERGERGDRAERSDRPERTERGERTERAEPVPGGQRDRERSQEADSGRDGDRGRDQDGRRGRGRRSRRRRGRGGRFPDSKYARVDDAAETGGPASGVRRPEPEERQQAAGREHEQEHEFRVLPGESLAKYSGPRGGDSGEPGQARAEAWSDDDDDAAAAVEAPGDDDEPELSRGRLDVAADDEEEDPGEFTRGRSRPEYERALAGDEDEPDDAIEASGGDERYSDESDTDVALAETFADEEESAAGEEDSDSDIEAGGDDGLATAEYEGEDDESAESDGRMGLDASEADELREAIRGSIEDDDAGEREPAGDEREEAAAAEGGPDGREDGARQARLRGGRGGASRYVHRRGGRRGRRRGRSRDAQEPVAAERTAGEFQPSPHTSITDLLTPGQEILVQISKEPLGKKGARITSHIAMPGRYLVYMPTVEHVGVSRKIANDNERLRLRRIVQSHRTGMPGGFIVRTAGSGASEEEIRGDMLFLYNLWLDIRQKAEQRPAPSLIHQDLDIVERVLRDQLGSDFKTMWVDSESEYERILRFVERFQPNLLSRVKLYTRSKPVFDAFNITPELEKALRPKVWLKSGGYIVINQTEALVAIDVNTGKFVGKSDRLEDTIVKTNVEAVQEIVRQIRLRDLGGIIVVDFIDMDDRKNRYKVAQALDQELRLDRAPSKSLQFNEFGLVAITRKRVKQSLERTLCTPCPYCTGSGFVKSIDTVILEILSEAKKMAPRVRSRKDLTIRVNPEVARALKSRDNSYLQEIEEIFRANVLVRGDVSLHREHFDIN